MSEASNSPESEKSNFDYNDLTPFEHAMIGSSVDCDIGGESVFINGKNIPELMGKDREARRAVLSPINLTNRKKNPDEIRASRSSREPMTALTLFNKSDYLKYDKMGMFPIFDGILDENYQLKEVDVYILKDGAKVNLPENVTSELRLNERFGGLLDYVGEKDNVMRFKIKD
jgi:hypothetical protein